MGYIRKVITKEEKLLSIIRPHWSYLVEGLFWFAGLTILGIIINHYFYEYVGLHAIKFKVDLWILQFDQRHTPIPWAFALTGFGVFWPLFLAYISAEVGLTEQRIIYKRGLMFIQIEQVDLEDIRAEHVSHGWLGWLLGYGRIRLDCRFIDDVWLPAMRDPYKLIKASHTARMKHPQIEYTPDNLTLNLEAIERQKQKAYIKGKIKRLKTNIKTGFKEAA